MNNFLAFGLTGIIGAIGAIIVVLVAFVITKRLLRDSGTVVDESKINFWRNVILGLIVLFLAWNMFTAFVTNNGPRNNIDRGQYDNPRYEVTPTPNY